MHLDLVCVVLRLCIGAVFYHRSLCHHDEKRDILIYCLSHPLCVSVVATIPLDGGLYTYAYSFSFWGEWGCATVVSP